MRCVTKQTNRSLEVPTRVALPEVLLISVSVPFESERTSSRMKKKGTRSKYINTRNTNRSQENASLLWEEMGREWKREKDL